MLSGLLDVFGGGPHLIMELRLDVVDSLVCVEAAPNVGKVLLHQVDVVVVVLHVDTRVTDEENAEAMEAFGNFFTLFQGCLGRATVRGCAQVEVHVNNRHIIEFIREVDDRLVHGLNFGRCALVCISVTIVERTRLGRAAMVGEVLLNSILIGSLLTLASDGFFLICFLNYQYGRLRLF